MGLPNKNLWGQLVLPKQQRQSTECKIGNNHAIMITTWRSQRQWFHFKLLRPGQQNKAMWICGLKTMLSHTEMLPGTIGNKPGILVTGTALDDGVADGRVDWGSSDDSTPFSVWPRSFLSSSSTVSIGTDLPFGCDLTVDSELLCSNSCSISSSVFAPPCSDGTT